MSTITTIVGQTTDTCQAFAWCDMGSDPSGEHAYFHSSHTIDVGSDVGEIGGADWLSAWLVRDRHDEHTSLVIEAVVGGCHMEAQVPAYAAAVLLATLGDPACRAAVEQLLEAVDQ